MFIVTQKLFADVQMRRTKKTKVEFVFEAA